MRRNSLFVLWLSVTAALYAAPEGGDPRFSIWLEPAQIVRPVGETRVQVAFSSTVDGIQGWSLGVKAEDAPDGTITLRIVDARMGPDLAVAGPQGAEPSFHSCTLYPAGVSCGARCPDCTGITQGVVLDFRQQVFVNATDRFVSLVLTVAMDGEGGGEPATLSFTDELGTPPIRTLMVVGGSSFSPAEQLGSEVYVVECEPNFRPHLGSVSGAVGSEKQIPVYLDFNHEGTADYVVQGWALGVRHDSSMLELLDVSIDGTDTQTAKNGGEPDFTQFKFVPAPPPGATEGFTHGVVLDFMSQVTLPAQNDFLDCIATYRLIGEPPCPDTLSTQVEAVGDLGDPVVRMVMVVEGESRVPCETDPAVVTIVCAQPFLRGDGNSDGRLDIADGIFIFNYLFLQGPEPDCLDAADANDDGAVDGSDGIYIINYQFLDGPPPPPPFPETGLDPTEDDLPEC